ncbi:DNA (cytosine-5)-methyltransferase DRM1-like [Rosa rugosa]|uniref:DNA (cytosine-5)-methyltransferase DRM1-like n=1 Tax=Rosa rugosa TaxID=74645 RepID=UPI002B41352D|nr:DNA (cytosine-5)-methyltransferase DRM1-like [Rosa rugosa]XP_062010159.1 DNA (cytosine-5)-methyltransferase DRM1-like [Rosa rugosa]XP_062010160.1 DNA (cytosine-5)-methyltransferase DRM1-like [Rosa rugosa]XP_062010161.1 DNA (cytosine-5)-methyltransferase DRM1-like [Rosa rugosa]
MDGNTSGVNGNNVDWDTEDELDEIENFTLSSSSANLGSGEGSSSPGPSNTKVFGHFVSMGFSQKMVAKAIQEHGEEDADSILESLLLYSMPSFLLMSRTVVRTWWEQTNQKGKLVSPR